MLDKIEAFIYILPPIMRKLYYFSKTNQKLKQFEYLSPKSILIYIVIVFFLLGTGWGIISLIEQFTSSSQSISALESENILLRQRLKSLVGKFEKIGEDLSELRTENNYLRVAADLPVISKDEAVLGVGGEDFSPLKKSGTSFWKDIDELSGFVDKLSMQLKFEKHEHQIISDKLKDNKVLFSSIPAIKPCEGVIGENGFGMREHPILGINRMHEGIDIITDTGTKVHSSGDGIINFVGYRGGYGLTVEVEHTSGYRTIYSHLFRTLVKEGQKISRGKVIALSGNTGLSTGPHLHYEVHHEGIKLDPTQFFFDDLVLFEQISKK